ncbi:MAG: hypothetical protein P4N24_02925 [Acidobacteriota bacterium]|nr:hypothetical protein [Acidobacteriota bacterium]
MAGRCRASTPLRFTSPTLSVCHSYYPKTQSFTLRQPASQILCEFYSIVTNARRVPKPRSPADALSAISGLLSFLHVLPIPVHTVEGWIGLLRRRPVTGGDIFDLQIVATMKANGVQRICTYNAEDFEVFPELAVLIPPA